MPAWRLPRHVAALSTPSRPDLLLELVECFFHRVRLVERSRLANFDAVNQRELDHALEIDLRELFPHDLENRAPPLTRQLERFHEERSDIAHDLVGPYDDGRCPALKGL